MYRGDEYISRSDLAYEYGCEEDYYKSRNKKPTEEELKKHQADMEERERLGFEKWWKKKREELEKQARQAEAEMERLKTYYSIKASKSKQEKDNARKD